MVRSRHLLLALFLVAGDLPALAVPPPDRPLPPCETDEDGEEVGACPKTSPEVGGSAVGFFTEYLPVGVYIEPAVPACDGWDKNGGGAWVPTPCYPAVERVSVVGCAYVDIRTDRFVERECASALYDKERPPAGQQLFKIADGAGGRCGAIEIGRAHV